MTLSTTTLFHYAECHCAECRYAECRGAQNLPKTLELIRQESVDTGQQNIAESHSRKLATNFDLISPKV